MKSVLPKVHLGSVTLASTGLLFAACGGRISPNDVDTSSSADPSAHTGGTIATGGASTGTPGATATGGIAAGTGTTATTGGSPACKGTLAFRSMPLTKTGASPTSVALGDLNDDGMLDIVTANFDSGTVSVLLGMGDGTFAAEMDFPVRGPLSVALGDFNDDGKLDIVAGSYVLPGVSVLLGKGDGTFAAKADTNAALGVTTIDVAPGDLNGDGKLDIVAANGDSTTGSVLLGIGDGTFTAEVGFGSNCALSVALGDLNGDGKLDVVTGNCDSYNGKVLLGNGDGTFVAKADYYTARGGSVRDVTLGDLNGDGKLDVVIANVGLRAVGVMLGRGDGTFAAAADFQVSSSTSVALGDLNGDGKLDIVTEDHSAATVSVLLGKGDGTFAAKVDYSTGNDPTSMALGDLNGDGKLDIVTVDYSSSMMSVRLNSCQ